MIPKYATVWTNEFADRLQETYKSQYVIQNIRGLKGRIKKGCPVTKEQLAWLEKWEPLTKAELNMIEKWELVK